MVEGGDVQYDLSVLGKYNNSQLDAIKELEESRRRASRVTNLKRLFELPVNDEKYDLNPHTQWTLIALYAQNKLTSKNADRR
jgi:hypothetical protein